MNRKVYKYSRKYMCSIVDSWTLPISKFKEKLLAKSTTPSSKEKEFNKFMNDPTRLVPGKEDMGECKHDNVMAGRGDFVCVDCGEKLIVKLAPPNKLDTLIDLIEDVEKNAYGFGISQELTGIVYYTKKLAKAKSKAFAIINSLKS